MRERRSVGTFVFFQIWIFFLGVPVFTEKVPAHLSLAFRLIETVSPSNNVYVHKPIFLSIKGSGGAEDSVNRTDCSGLLILLMKEAYGVKDVYFVSNFGRSRPLAKHFHTAIKEGRGMQGIKTAPELRAGDVLAVEYTEGVASGDTGHIMIVASNYSIHWLRPASNPVVEGTQQIGVPIVDSSASPHFRPDTRPQGQTGVGQGFLRIYVMPVTGEIDGYSWSFGPASKFYGGDQRPILAGRLVVGK